MFWAALVLRSARFLFCYGNDIILLKKAPTSLIYKMASDSNRFQGLFIQMVKYSIIIPLFNEAENFDELIKRVKSAMDCIDGSYEIVLIDDGSDDGTFNLISEAAKIDTSIVGVKLSRNFGQDNAILAGMKLSGGEDLVLMDGDLQDPPEFIPKMIEQKNKGYSVVYGVKLKRKEFFAIRFLTLLFYRLMRCSPSTKSVPIRVKT